MSRLVVLRALGRANRACAVLWQGGISASKEQMRTGPQRDDSSGRAAPRRVTPARHRRGGGEDWW